MYDVSIVTDGAYANTQIKKRSLEIETVEPHDRAAEESAMLENEIDILQKEIDILNLKK